MSEEHENKQAIPSRKSKRQGNRLCIFALVLSILALLTLGFLAPVALIVATICIARQKSAIAIAAFSIAVLGIGLMYFTWVLWPIGPALWKTLWPGSPYNKYIRNTQAARGLCERLVEEHVVETLKDGEEILADKSVVDIWGRGFRLRRDDGQSSRRCVLFSVGKDGLSGTQDDMLIWDLIRNEPIPPEESF